MQKRKLQIFLSSTYEDLIDHRLAAIEAILAAGHIPAAMEQFSPGDETAWEKITTWIDESDAFILILGGRDGSIEPTTGKSYVQREYEYALSKEEAIFRANITNSESKRLASRSMSVHILGSTASSGALSRSAFAGSGVIRRTSRLPSFRSYRNGLRSRT
jgi:hypothetical protein